MKYANVSDALGFFPIVTEPVDSKVEAVFKEMLENASRIFETETNARFGQYAKTDDTPAIKKFFGNGTQFLHTEPIFELVEIKNSNDEVIDAEMYQLLDSQTIYFNARYCSYLPYLLRKKAEFFVDAKWGYECVPADVVIAVKSKAVIFLQRSPLPRINSDYILEEEFVDSLDMAFNSVVEKYSTRNRELRYV